MDMKTGAILYAKGIDEQRYPASITKILTALVAIENSKPTDMVKFSQESIQSLRAGICTYRHESRGRNYNERRSSCFDACFGK